MAVERTNPWIPGWVGGRNNRARAKIIRSKTSKPTKGGKAMKVLIFLIILVAIFGSNSNDTATPASPKPRKLSRKERKRIQKARDRAEMDAWEDMIMYMEVFSDD